MTVSKLIKILKQAEINGEGQQEIMVEVKDPQGFGHEYPLDMYHCARNLKNLHYNVCPLVPFHSN